MMSSLDNDDTDNKQGYGSPSGTPPPAFQDGGEGDVITSITSSHGSFLEDSTKNIDKVYLTGNPNSSFTRVETPQIGFDTFGDDATARALKTCRQTVLRPYHLFLKIIGWRKLNPPEHMSEVLKCFIKGFNILWPVFLTLLLITSCVTQILLCFGRDNIKPNPRINNDTTYRLDCHTHIVSYYVILDTMLVFAFLYGLYIFRVKEPEHLSTFTERVFLGVITRHGVYSPKTLIRGLQFLLIFGLIWIIYSFFVSIVRVFAHHYFSFKYTVDLVFLPDDTHPAARVVIVIISILGFIVFDVAYTTIVINYSIQCQLMIYYLQSICTRVKDKEWEIDQAIKEISDARQFLSKLNSHMARATSIMLFILLLSCFNSIYGLEELMKGADDLTLIAATGVLSVIQWTAVFLLPFIQAARVTRSGVWVKKTALEIRSRPFRYKETPQLELDSFVTYCSNLNMTAKIASIPISPALVLGFSFILGFVLYLVLGIDNDSFLWAPWL